MADGPDPQLARGFRHRQRRRRGESLTDHRRGGDIRIGGGERNHAGRVFGPAEVVGPLPQEIQGYGLMLEEDVVGTAESRSEGCPSAPCPPSRQGEGRRR